MTNATNSTNLTDASLSLFLALTNDAPNWGGQTLFGGNVGGDAASKGNLTDLKKKGLLTTTDIDGDGCHWIGWTEAGLALAAANGIDTDDLYRG
jgi:hypothetical protein